MMPEWKPYTAEIPAVMHFTSEGPKLIVQGAAVKQGPAQ